MNEMVKRQLSLIKRGVTEIIPENEFKDKLKLSIQEKRPLRIKFGADPTAPDLHLGHLVILRKLKQFQELGHQIIFLIGDFTALIGDPSGRTETRPTLSRAEIKKNAATYQKQIFRFLDSTKTKVVYNSEWLEKMDIGGFLKLSSYYTVARMLERDDFLERYRNNKPITILEFLYPLLQGYDSVELKADVEVGGVDQKFNLLVGREFQREFKQPPQAILTLPLLEGTDGVKKMSKSYGNYIGINESAKTIYGKIMSIPDFLIIKYFELLTDVEEETIKNFQEGMSKGNLNPRDVKMDLAKEITGIFYPPEKTEEAARDFRKVYTQKDIPDSIEVVDEKTLRMLEKEGNSVWIISLLTRTSWVASGKKARSLINQGGVKIDGEVVKDIDFRLDLSKEHIIKIGKHMFKKIPAR